MQSKVLSGKGRHSAFAIVYSILPTMPLSVILSRPTRSIDSLMSASTTRPCCPTILLNFAARSPVPPAISRTWCPGLTPEKLYSEAFPNTMHASRHEIIHQVVFGRYGVEYASNHFFLVTFFHSLVAEMSAAGVGL